MFDARARRVAVSRASRAILLPSLAAVSIVACTARDSERPVTSPRTSTPTTSRGTIIDFAPLIRVGGVVYLEVRVPKDAPPPRLASPYSVTQFKLAGNVSDPSYHAKDGDAAFLEPGTVIYTVDGFDPSEMLGVRRQPPQSGLPDVRLFRVHRPPP